MHLQAIWTDRQTDWQGDSYMPLQNLLAGGSNYYIMVSDRHIKMSAIQFKLYWSKLPTRTFFCFIFYPQKILWLTQKLKFDCAENCLPCTDL